MRFDNIKILKGSRLRLKKKNLMVNKHKNQNSVERQRPTKASTFSKRKKSHDQKQTTVIHPQSSF
jgi:hypothetical protein